MGSNHGEVLVEPAELERVIQLKTWYKKARRDSLQPLTHLPEERSGGQRDTKITNIAGLKLSLSNDEEFMSGANPDLSRYFKVVAQVLLVPHQRILWYEACPSCRRKLENTLEQKRRFSGGSGFGLDTSGYCKCQHCTAVFKESIFVYNFSVKIGDHSDTMFLNVLGEQVGNSIM